MKYLLLSVIMLSSCSKKSADHRDPVQIFEVEKLFTQDGCTVFRFHDGGYDHYFTNCTETISTQFRQVGKMRKNFTENIGAQK